MKKLTLIAMVVLLSTGCMKTEQVGDNFGGGGSRFANGTAGVKTGDKYLSSMMSALGVVINNDVRTTYANGRNALPFNGEYTNVTSTGTYADNGLAMRVALIAVTQGLANQGSNETKALLDPARGQATAFDEAKFVAVAENASQRILRRSLLPEERTALVEEVFNRIRSGSAMTDPLRQEILMVGIAAILTSQEFRSSN